MSNIAKRHIPTQDLLGEYLTFVPNPGLVDDFHVDMRALHPTLLRDSIRELVKTGKVQNIPQQAQRAAIYAVYHRKIKESAALYPFVFAVENGLRSALADHLEAVFGSMDWWVILRNQWMAHGANAPILGNIHGVQVKARFIKTVYYAFNEMGKEQKTQITGPNKSDEFYYALSFGQLFNLIKDEWNLIRPMFLDDAVLSQPLRQSTFETDMGIIKVGRNAIFHSNPIKNRSAFVSACERVLDLLAFNLEDYDQDMAATTISRVHGAIARAPRHIMPPR